MKETLEHTTAALNSLQGQHAKLEKLKEEKDSAVDKLSGKLTVKLTKW